MMNRNLSTLVALIGLCLLMACASPDVFTPTLGDVVTPVAQNTAPATPAAASTSTLIATLVATTLPESPLPILLPGWGWYQSNDGVYAIAYPQSWQVQGSGAGGTIFSSPGTGSQVRISRRPVPVANEDEGNAAAPLPDAPSATVTPSPPTCTNWLTNVSTHK